MKIPTSWILIGIFFLAVLLRFYQLGQVPTILNRDEAALAYNALLLKETSLDEWQKKWPVALQSFGDYKLIGYPLTLVGSFGVFGYQDWVVKLPSALAGCILVLSAYFWARKSWQWPAWQALFLAFLVAIQPIFFFYSRIAFEANLALTFFVTSLAVFFRRLSAQEKGRTIVPKDLLATLLFVSAIFIYNTPLLLLPFLIPMLIWWRGIKNLKRWWPAIIGMSIVLFVGGITLFSLSQQKSGITIFNDEDVWLQSVQYHQQFSGVAQKIFANKAVFYGRIIVDNYLQTLSPAFLVQQGGAHPWHTLPGWGHLYWTTYLLGWVGIGATVFQFLRQISQKITTSLPANLRNQLLILGLLFLAPLPATITVDAPHATRSLFFFLIWLVFSAIGLATIGKIRQKMPWFLLILGLAIGLESVEAVHYFDNYFRYYPTQSTAILRAGYPVAIQQVWQDSAPNVAVIDDGGYQYILTAWYLKLPASEFFATIQRHQPDLIGFQYGYRLGKLRFIKEPTDRFADEKVLIQWNPEKNQWSRVDY